MLRGRIVAARGVKAEISSRRRKPHGCCTATAASPIPADVPAGSQVVEGEWWPPDYTGPPLVSFEKKIADGLGLKIGDDDHRQRARPQHHAKIANLRTRGLAEPRHQFRAGVLAQRIRRRAAHPYRDADRAHADSRRATPRSSSAVADAFPTVTSVRVREALETVGTVVTNLVLAIRGASAVTLIVRHAGAGRRAGRRPPPPGL